uniref:Uncharacterized protein n=1 Tax=Meloidogyne enterolobii TaxID=390850 RepID=A0A6V7XEW8_MELEN|nr:unnamed protein product [Meloidogyne enterolobii]
MRETSPTQTLSIPSQSMLGVLDRNILKPRPNQKNQFQQQRTK